ncbi:MAG: hypothetical protein VYD19_10740, partial [Myxococcota bacterium]|nr:hypothetical protein [Myxococcota bacterium]
MPTHHALIRSLPLGTFFQFAALTLALGCTGGQIDSPDRGGAPALADQDTLPSITGGAGGTGGGAGGIGGSGGAGGGVPETGRPRLERIGDKVIGVGETLELQLVASDAEGDPLFFNLRSPLPEGAKFDKLAGLFTWTPFATQAGSRVLLTFEVSDGELSAQETIA